jgi:outer membrane protein insertion porin family
VRHGPGGMHPAGRAGRWVPVLLVLLLSSSPAAAQDTPEDAPRGRSLFGSVFDRLPAEEPVSRVRIDGNIRVEEDAIRVHLQTQEGRPFDQAAVDEDIKSIYAMGFFDKVDADVTKDRKGAVVTFRVVERPLVRNVTVEGNEKLKKEEIEGALRIRPHTILDPEKARQGIDAARKLYADKGYLDARITYDTVPVGENEVDVRYTVTESSPVRVQDIEFEGNEAFSSRKLRSLMQTKEAWILTPITGAGNLNTDVLRADMERLTAWYYDNGYVTARIDEPKVERRGDGLAVVVKIDEGPQFKIGRVEITGAGVPQEDLQLPPDMATKPGEVFSAGALRDDVQRLTERLSEGGFAFANIEPATDIDPEEKVVNIDFQVERGSPVTVDRIEVTGNSKTRDYVIRREMRLQEQELFSATKLRKSREALQRVGFFQEVNITTRKSPVADDRMDVVVDVKEAQTGSFSAGAGFSSADSLLFNVRIQENNLFGRGQRLVANVDVGSIRRNIILSFTEPYFRGTPLTVGFDAFSWRLAFEDFDRTGTGASVQVTYPLTAFGWESLWGIPLDEVRIGADYRIERAKISDVGFDAPVDIREAEGTSTISSVTPRISRNTLNHFFDPTAGSAQDLSVEIAGLGGERFVKAEARTRWYYTFLRSKTFGDFTYSLGASGAYGVGDAGVSGNELPLFERYFPGGINSIRGFEPRTLGPRQSRKNTRGQAFTSAPVGGSSQLILNNEIIFPLVQGIGLKGVVFFDAGNAYGGNQNDLIDDARYAAGGGLRWLSPLGPLRVELGFPFNTKPGDQEQLLLFSFGGPFQF